MNEGATSKHCLSLLRAAAIGLSMIFAVSACEKNADKPAANASNAQFTIYTTFYPTAYFTQQIVGDLAHVVCPVPDGEDPIFWQPSRQVIMEYQQADLIVTNGAEFEKWIPTVSLPISRVIDSAAPFADRFVHYDAASHNHGLKGKHAHVGVDGHTWLDPNNAKEQANTILNALITNMPEREMALRENFASLAADLDQLDARMQQIALMLADVKILASHPAYNYLAARYNIEITNLNLDPLGPPDQLTSIPDSSPSDRPAILLWEAQPSDAITAQAHRIGYKNVVFSPCESLDESDLKSGQSYLAIFKANLDRLEQAAQN